VILEVLGSEAHWRQQQHLPVTSLSLRLARVLAKASSYQPGPSLARATGKDRGQSGQGWARALVQLLTIMRYYIFIISIFSLTVS